MSRKPIRLSPRAQERLAEIADYLSQQSVPDDAVVRYLSRLEQFLESVLSQFPDSGTPMPEYGDDVRRVVYQKYSFLYRAGTEAVEILTIYRENQP